MAEAKGDGAADSTTSLFVFRREATSPTEFVGFWARLYSDNDRRLDEELYVPSIGHPLTEERLRKLFTWKIGSPKLTRQLEIAEARFISRADELRGLPEDMKAEAFFDRFSTGGAIWRIFALHCRYPTRYPIFDQHVNRAMTCLEDGHVEELPSTDHERLERYLNRYLRFYSQFSDLETRDVDRAIWAFGKLVKKCPRLAL